MLLAAVRLLAGAFSAEILTGCSEVSESLKILKIYLKFLKVSKFDSPIDSPNAPSEDCGSRWFLDLKPGAKL